MLLILYLFIYTLCIHMCFRCFLVIFVWFTMRGTRIIIILFSPLSTFSSLRCIFFLLFPVYNIIKLQFDQVSGQVLSVDHSFFTCLRNSNTMRRVRHNKTRSLNVPRAGGKRDTPSKPLILAFPPHFAIFRVTTGRIT